MAYAFGSTGGTGKGGNAGVRRSARWGLAALLLCLACALIACGGESTTDEDDAPASGGASASGSSGASSGDADAVVSYQNPGGEPRALDASANDALAGASPLGAVTWASGPTVGGGELAGEGTLLDGATLFAPEVGDGGYAFAVHYKGQEEPMVVVLPGLGAMVVWESTHTIAEMDYELEGAKFSFRAYSPLFMDVGDGDLELRTYGYDANNQPALLDVRTIG